MAATHEERHNEAEPSAPVWLSRLVVQDFRAHARARLQVDQGPVILFGSNGGGKTSLLEAISYLGPGRGLRRARHAHAARHRGAGGWAVAATLEGGGAPLSVGTSLGTEADAQRRQPRAVMMGGKRARGPSALARVLRLLWLTPAMDRLFSGDFSLRRRFLDRIVASLDPNHGRHATAYERAMRERNRILATGGDAVWARATEATMARTGTRLARARLRALLRLNALADEKALARFPAVRLSLEGAFEEALLKNAEDGEAWLRRALEAGRRGDARAKGAQTGPHKARLVACHLPSGQEAAQCSTGEQKALLLGILLLAARLLRDVAGTTPVLLLDEVAAHLDPERRAGLFEALDALGTQAWMTGTERHPFAALSSRAQFFQVAPGDVRPAA